MRRVIALALVLTPVCPSVQAGAWARVPGEVFLSFSTSLQSGIDALTDGIDATSRHDSAYVEVGLGRRLTFASELGRSEYTQEAMAILRYTLTQPDARLQVAVDLGAGRRQADSLGDSSLARIGLSLGYGFGITPPDWMPMDLQGGWIALDASAVRDLTREEDRWKIDATFGLTISDRTRFIMQVGAEEWAGLDVTYTLNPSIVHDIRSGTSLEIGLQAVHGDEVQLGLELGFWHQF